MTMKNGIEFIDAFRGIMQDVMDNTPEFSEKKKNFVDLWRKNVKGIVELFYRLEDEKSRDTYLKLLRYYLGILMSGESVQEKYSLYPRDVWKDFMAKADAMPHVKRQDYVLDRVECFVLEGYRYKDIVGAKEGDVVLDCGVYTGNTALYFSSCVGETGIVHAFEAMPSNFEVLAENLKEAGLSNVLAYNFAICEGKKKVRFNEDGGSSRASNSGKVEVQGISIDEFVDEYQIQRVDYLKMDIEGSECSGLEGGIKTIRTFRPKLAICVYHKPSDFIDIPAKILAICPDYQFYLGHSSHRHMETVLFAIANGEKNISLLPEEVEATEVLFDLYWKVYKNKEALLREERKRILEAYGLQMRDVYQRNWMSPVYDEKNYRYVKFPLSEDGDLHYEIGGFDQNRVQVALHFEKNWNSKRDEIPENLSKLETPLHKTRLGYSYELGDGRNVKYICGIMDYLVECTLPILLEKGIVSDDVRMRIRRNLI